MVLEIPLLFRLIVSRFQRFRRDPDPSSSYLVMESPAPLALSALAPPSASRHLSPGRKPLALKDPNRMPFRKQSVQKPSAMIRRGSRQVVPAATQEIVPLVDRPKTLDQLLHQYRSQQGQLVLLKQELTAYKARTNKTMEIELFERFEGINKNEVVTQFTCKWFGVVIMAHLVFYYFYYVLRQGSQTNIDDDAFSGSTPLGVMEDGILQVSCYSFSYMFIVLLDIFWTILFPDKVRCERTTARTHVIVAAHRAHASLEVMLPTVLQTFAPECIWVADNGFPDIKAEALCQRLGINYEYNEVGNKANALVVVARKIKRRHGDAIQNVVLLDDDTELGHDFFIRHDLLSDPRVGGYCVGIAINRSPPFNVWEIAIDFEYRAISHAFGARATCSTLPFCHGICAVYKLDLMIEMYSKNWSLPGGLPFGEDGYAGIDYRMAGYNLRQDNANVVLTYCPRRFFPPLFTRGRVQGYGASSLWKQRACRWFLSWPRQLPAEFWLFLTYRAGTWYGNIQYRIYAFWWFFLNCVSVAWVPYMFFVWLKHESWFLVLLLKGMLTVTGILVSMIRIIAFPSKLRRGTHFLSPLCSPILGMANSILRFFGFVFALYWFIPFFRVNKVRVLGDPEEDVPILAAGAFASFPGEHKCPSLTEEPSETEEYYDVDLEDAITNAAVSKSWMELLGDNLKRSNGLIDPVPSLASYSSSSSSGDTSVDDDSPPGVSFSRFEI